MQHDTALTVFVIIIALAFVAQAVIMYGMFLAMKDLHTTIDRESNGMRQSVEDIQRRVNEFLSETRQPVHTIATNLAEISRMLRERSTQVDAFIADLVDRSRLQVIRVDQMVSGVVRRMESTAAVVERGVVAPLQEAAAVIRGVRTGLEFLFTKRRVATASRATEDDQMFI